MSSLCAPMQRMCRGRFSSRANWNFSMSSSGAGCGGLPGGVDAYGYVTERVELSLKVVDERERRRTLLGKLNTTPQRPGATRGKGTPPLLKLITAKENG